MSRVTVNVHVAAGDNREVHAYEAEHGPFVALQIGEDFRGVTLMVRDEESLNDLASMVAEARARLAAVINRAKRDAATQPELPVAS